MSSRRIEGLPYLPGNTFVDPTLCDFRRSQIFEFKNGFRVPKHSYLGIGSVPIEAKALTVKDLFDIYNYDPSLTYGKPRSKPKPPIVPRFVQLAKRVRPSYLLNSVLNKLDNENENISLQTLRFYGYFKETVNDSPDETYRVRQVELLYYLEDDTMMISEPKIQNSGLMQGKFLHRHRVPKNNLGETYNWKDLNLRCELLFYGRAFRIVDADQFTKNYYESEGIILNDPEPMPKDPFTDKRYLTLQKRTFCRTLD